MAPKPMTAAGSLLAAVTSAWAGLGLLLLVTVALILYGSLRSAPLAPNDSSRAGPRPSPRDGGRDTRLVLWLAEGCGVGRLPLGPGTFGSVVGVSWTLALLATQNVWWYGLGLLVGLGLSVRVCGAGERLLGVTDPGSVVLDEIAAVPLGFGGWIGARLWLTGEMPAVDALLSGRGWVLLLGGFVAFRLFDILKPWPVRQSQALPGGWGVTLDDVLAAVYANLVWLPFAWLGWL